MSTPAAGASPNIACPIQSARTQPQASRASFTRPIRDGADVAETLLAFGGRLDIVTTSETGPRAIYRVPAHLQAGTPRQCALPRGR